MKFIKFKDRVDGNTDTDSHIIIGRLIESGNMTGIYLIFRSPIKFKSKYISSTTFEECYGVCRNHYLCWIRKYADGKIYPWINKATLPINMENIQ